MKGPVGPESSAVQGVKAQQTKHWDRVASGWAAWLEWTERNFSPITDWLTRAAGWAPGVRALDIACGAGYPALVGAARVHPGGMLVATDISPAMIAAARERARAARLQNVEFCEMDAEDLRFDDRSFDAVTNAYGLMFCPDPQRALDEARRVLRPGGQLALSTWDEPSKSPFFSVITSVAAPILSLAAPDSSAPGPFRLASPARLASMLAASGFSGVHVENRAVTFECASIDAYCQLFIDVGWKGRVARLSDVERVHLRDAVREAAHPFLKDGRLRLTATSVCASARTV